MMLIENASSLGELQSTQSAPTFQNPVSNQPVPVTLNELAGPPLPESSGRTLDNISQFHAWYMLGELQSNLSSAQSGEYSLTMMYQKFTQLLQALNSSNTNSLAQRVTQWETQRLAEGALDAELKPVILEKDGAQQSFILDKVDLLSLRPKDEQVTFFFRDNRSTISINLPANTGKADLLNLVQKSFAKAGITVQLGKDGQLQLSIADSDKQRLVRQVYLSGEGYRIPAGNPLLMKLIPVTPVLTQLAQQLLNFTPDQYTSFVAQIETLRKLMRQRIDRLRKYRKQMLKELDGQSTQTNANETAEEIQSIQSNIRQILNNDNFRMTSTVLAAQTNLSKRTVVALLLDFL